ncbi:transposase [Chryseobacterium sp.]|uniref:transposase n=1 Tax=Chryseobacterium sp. TaxID=1871047 RepID=UPI0023F3B418|nr:transposase [Chryseobacterium sp.]
MLFTLNEKRIAKKCFSGAVQEIDRFHIQKLAIEAVQEIRDQAQKLGGNIK